MLSWLYDILMTVVTFLLGLFGVDLTKRSVTFADDVKDDKTLETAVTANSESITVESVTESNTVVENSD